MKMRIIPKLCLSTILFEIGVFCALVTVNSKPLDSVANSASWIGTTTGGYAYTPGYITNFYGWPRPFLHAYDRSSDDTNTQKYFIVGSGLVVDLIAWLAIFAISAAAIEISIWYAKKLIKQREIEEPPLSPVSELKSEVKSA